MQSSVHPSHRRVLGIETEYGLVYEGPGGPSRNAAAVSLYHEATQHSVHLPGARGDGIWFGNGARFYVDAGAHPEFCTPETEDPVETMRQVLAGDRILARLLDRINARKARSHPGWRLYKGNVDYAGALSSWACHESYSTRRFQSELASSLVPHLVSRIIYTGAGGLNPFADGIELCLSPRVYHIRRESSGSSTGGRGILHEKDEPLASCEWHRLHILCGDSVCSHRAGVLKMGTTALVVALAEAGMDLGADLRLADPVKAFHRFNGDLTLQAEARLRSGRHVSALDMQRQLLRKVRDHLHQPVMPAWAEPLCQLWEETLDQLGRGPAAVVRSLDWAIKWWLYGKVARDHGFPLESHPEWNQRVQGTRAGSSEEDEEAPPSGRRPPQGASTSRQAPARQRLDGRAREYLGLRARLGEAETRFSLIHESGLFHRLDSAGHLDHHVPGLSEASIEQATLAYTGPGRARLRSLFVRKHARTEGFACDWNLLIGKAGRHYDLSNPFLDRFPRASMPLRTRRHAGSFPDLGGYWRMFAQGRYSELHAELTSTRQRQPLVPRFRSMEMRLLEARVLCRLGRFIEAKNKLREWAISGQSRLEIILEHVSLFRFQGLQPRFQDVQPWLEEADALPNREMRRSCGSALVYHSHKAHILGRLGRVDEAVQLFEEILSGERWADEYPRTFSRSCCDLADLYRRLGRSSVVRQHLQHARSVHERHALPGDFAEFLLVAEAKAAAATHAGSVRQTLLAARNQLLRCGSPMGLARVVALEARLAGGGEQEERRDWLRRLWVGVPGLRQCPLLQRLLDHWKDWVSGGQPEGEEDVFWNL